MPKFVLNGIDDQSMVTPPPSALEEPMHLPLYYIRARRGRTTPFLGNAADAMRLFGADTFDVRGAYYNHVTEHARLVCAQGQQVYWKRIDPVKDSLDPSDDSKISALTLGIKVTPAASVDKYFRDSVTLQIVKDTVGNKVFAALEGGTEKAGVDPVTGLAVDPALFGSGDYTDWATVPETGIVQLQWVVMDNMMGPDRTIDSDTDIAGVYPIIRFDAGDYGSHGDLIGMQIWSNSASSRSPADPELQLDQQSQFYSARIQRREHVTKAWNNVKAISSAEEIQFAFKPERFNVKTNTSLEVNRLVSEYEDDGIATSRSPVWGPLGNVKVNNEMLDAVLLLMSDADNAVKSTYAIGSVAAADMEIVQNTGITSTAVVEDMANDVGSFHLLDITKAVYPNGLDAFGYRVLNSVTGDNINLREGATYSLNGGADGAIFTDADFESRVDFEINHNTENPDYPLLEELRFPFSAIYDSGFSTLFKPTLMKWASLRKDVHVTIGTAVAGEPALSPSDEFGRAEWLYTQLAMYAGNESDKFGTPTTRVVICTQSGIVTNSTYRKRVPALVFELGAARAGYLGAGNGKIGNTLRYTETPYNKLRFVSDLSSTYFPEPLRQKVWDVGACYAQYSDRKQLFIPGWKTAYPHPNSVLTAELFMQICVDVQKMSMKVWAMLTGNHSLTSAEFAEESDKQFNILVAGKYDGLVTVVPNTRYTPLDEANGFSWVQDVVVYGNVMKTVAEINVITRRQSMLEGN